MLQSKPIFEIKNHWKKSIKENFRQYLLNSSLHGLKYIGLPTITNFERIYFLSSFILVLFLSFYFISNVYEKWSASPVIITLGAKATFITDFPFPAVTICNMNKARMSIARDFKNGSLEEALLQNFCLDEFSKSSDVKAYEGSAGQWSVFKDFLKNISQSCDEMLIMCRFSGLVQNCMELFETVMTDEGLCCTFNAVHSSFLYQNFEASQEFDFKSGTKVMRPADWTPETGYPTNTDKRNTYPRPAAGVGSHLGLNVILNVDVNDYFCSSTDSAGFKILLHNPIEKPQIASYGVLVTPGLETRLIITPRIGTSSKLLRNIDQNHRQCIFAGEANLTYFRTYSKRNCEMECQSRVIEDKCGCVIFYMPRLSPQTKICGRVDVSCYRDVKLSVEKGELTKNCYCLPACSELSFTGTTSSAPIVSNLIYSNDAMLKNFTNDKLRDLAIVEIFYVDNYFRSNVKEELTGFTEFLSNTGGLLGLFMGFSVVSLIEIIYYVALRPSFRRFYTKTNSTNPINGHLLHPYSVEKLTVRPFLTRNFNSIHSRDTKLQFLN